MGIDRMLSNRIKTVLDTLNITITDVAKAGGCTPSNLSRIKNGVRTPPPASPTISCLTDGLIKIARQRDLSSDLRMLCGAMLRDNDEVLKTKLIDWLYKDEPPYVRTYQKKKGADTDVGRQTVLTATVFSEHLDHLMKTIGLSNRRLGCEAGLDPSYISRLRRGERVPRFHSAYLTQICVSLKNSILSEEKLSEVSKLTTIPPEELLEKGGADALRKWLFGSETATVYLAAEELMKTITSVDEIIHATRTISSEEYDIKKILEDFQKNDSEAEWSNDQRYVGIGGIQSAVMRFLIEFIQNNEKELLLYSDQSMDWMDRDYRLVLKALLIELIRKDVKIRIIHTLDRSMTELISAIEWWMPLYLSGNIRSFYCQNNPGKRFSHTLFIRPGAACISGTSAIGLESRATYLYSTDSEMTGLAEDTFANIMKDSFNLVQIGAYDGSVSNNDGFIRIGDVTVQSSLREVKIRRINPPYLMFTFTHPMICRAFKLYMDIATNV